MTDNSAPDQTASRGGRPAVGPAISVAYPAELLDEIDAAASRRMVTRAQWLRTSAHTSLPHDAMGQRDHLHEVLREADSWLFLVRDAALDAENAIEDRIFRGTAYSAFIHEMRTLLGAARDALPLQEVREATAQMSPLSPDYSEGSARSWGRAMAVEALDQLLDALSVMQPSDGSNVASRARLNDPMMDLQP